MRNQVFGWPTREKLAKAIIWGFLAAPRLPCADTLLDEDLDLDEDRRVSFAETMRDL